MKEKIFNTLFIKIISAFISFFTVVMLSQVLGADGRGEASIIITTISIVIIFSEFSGGGALVYLVPRNNIKSLLITCYIWSFGISLLAWVLIENIFLIKGDYAFHIASIAFMISVSGANAKVLIAKERVSQNNLVQFSQVLIIFIGLLILFYFYKNQSIESYIFSLYASASFSCFLSFLLIFSDIRNENSDKIKFLFKETLRFGTMNQMAHVSQFLSFRASFYIIEKFWGTGMVGIYSNGVSIAESIWIISKSIALVQYSKITNTENEEYSRNLTINLTKITILFSAILLIPLLLLPGSFYAFLFGPEFSALPHVILSLSPGIIFFVVALILGHYFSGTGKYGVNAIASTGGLIITLILGFILIPVSPIWGAGITASISYFVTAVVVVYLFFKNRKDSWFVLIPQKKDLLLLLNKMRKRN